MKKLCLPAMLLFVLFSLSSCIPTNAVPPGFMELLAQFDEISEEGSSFSFLKPHHSVSVKLNFIGGDESRIVIPSIRDAFAEYMMSDEIVSFFENRRMNHSEISITIVIQQETTSGVRNIVTFLSSAKSSFESWETHSSDNRFLEEHPLGVWKSEEHDIILYFLPEYAIPPNRYVGFFTIGDIETKVIAISRPESNVWIYDANSFFNQNVATIVLFRASYQNVDEQWHFILDERSQERMGYERIILQKVDDYDPINPEDWFPLPETE
jgi:hypothetical protein